MLRVVQYGCGKMSKYTMRYVFEKSGKIVGAFDIDESKIGKDISVIMEMKKPYNVPIMHARDFEDFLLKEKPDIVIVTTMSLLKDVEPALLICASCGVNAITTCEEAFYPQNSNYPVFNKIDSLAKQNDCTICGSGYQDVFWGNLISVVAGATYKISKIVGKSSYNVEDYGIALARAHGAGLSAKDFELKIASVNNISEKEINKKIKDGDFLPSYMWNVNGWLASKLGLDVVSQTQKSVPQFATDDINSSTLKMTIPKGYSTGMSAVVTTKTAQGVEIVSECIGKVYSHNEFDCNQWVIEGEPTTKVIIERPSTVELTCATIVNRLGEVISAPSGYFTTDKMNENRYCNILK